MQLIEPIHLGDGVAHLAYGHVQGYESEDTDECGPQTVVKSGTQKCRSASRPRFQSMMYSSMERAERRGSASQTSSSIEWFCKRRLRGVIVTRVVNPLSDDAKSLAELLLLLELNCLNGDYPFRINAFQLLSKTSKKKNKKQNTR